MNNSEPLWQNIQMPSYPRIGRGSHYDVVVIGGGVVGLTAAWFLKQAGKRVCLLERGQLGNGETGHTTAHLTCVTDVRLGQLAKTFGRESAALTWYAGIAALDLIERNVRENDISCNFRRTPGYLHAALEGDQDESADLRAEAELARELGFDASYVEHAPIVDKPGMRVSNQAKFHPLAYLAGLAQLVAGDGCVIHEHSEVSDVEADPLVVVANDVRIACDYVIVATHVPLMGKNGLLKASLLQSKLTAYSTYVISGKLPAGSLPDVSLWDTSNPYYYLCVDAGPKMDRVIFGGNDHKTGQQTDTEDCYQRLEEVLSRMLPSLKLDHRWSGQVIDTNDGLPLIGETSERQFVATGFNGNGITFGTLAALMARDAVLKQQNPWQELFSVDRQTMRHGAWDYIKHNMDYPYYLLADRLIAAHAADGETHLAPGEGAILKIDGKRVACSCDEDGHVHGVSAVCPHLGCLVHWNGAEQTWDCPCHGSRFLPTGKVIAGPAESPLEPVDLPHTVQ